ncbi:MAG: non-heme iron oxygenase ferredoxin subunit [Acidobacteria bacterium]|nr:non-heme iron oxygenase ferredoxin subunit [Acidobacteriota bacterium]
MEVRVCGAREIPPGEMRRVWLDGTPVALANVGGEFLAIGDTCSHAEASLSEGILEDGVVECPRHGATFDVRTGENRSLPATRPVPSFRVSVRDGGVWLEGGSE